MRFIYGQLSSESEKVRMLGKAFSLIFDISSPWLYLSAIWSLFQYILWRFIIGEVLRSDDPVFRQLLAGFYLLFSAADKALFILAVRGQPSFDFGFWASVAVPTILFYGSMVSALFFARKARRFGFGTVEMFWQFVPGMYSIAAAQVSFAMGYSAPTGVVMGLVAVIAAGWKAIAIRPDVNGDKTKEKTN